MLEPKFITRPIKKALKSKGFDLFAMGGEGTTPDSFDDTMNAVIDALYPNHTAEIDSMPYGEIQALFRACMDKTFPTKETVEK